MMVYSKVSAIEKTVELYSRDIMDLHLKKMPQMRQNSKNAIKIVLKKSFMSSPAAATDLTVK